MRPKRVGHNRWLWWGWELAAVMLACSGVAQIHLIDFDYVTPSSLNRYTTAGLADVGTSKVQCVARVLRGIAPFVQVEPRIELWRGGAQVVAGNTNRQCGRLTVMCNNPCKSKV